MRPFGPGQMAEVGPKAEPQVARFGLGLDLRFPGPGQTAEAGPKAKPRVLTVVVMHMTLRYYPIA